MCGPYTCIPTQFHPQFRYPYKGSNDIRNLKILYSKKQVKIRFKSLQKYNEYDQNKMTTNVKIKAIFTPNVLHAVQNVKRK